MENYPNQERFYPTPGRRVYDRNQDRSDRNGYVSNSNQWNRDYTMPYSELDMNQFPYEYGGAYAGPQNSGYYASGNSQADTYNSFQERQPSYNGRNSNGEFSRGRGRGRGRNNGPPRYRPQVNDCLMEEEMSERKQTGPQRYRPQVNNGLMEEKLSERKQTGPRRYTGHRPGNQQSDVQVSEVSHAPNPHRYINHRRGNQEEGRFAPETSCTSPRNSGQRNGTQNEEGKRGNRQQRSYNPRVKPSSEVKSSDIASGGRSHEGAPNTERTKVTAKVKTTGDSRGGYDDELDEQIANKIKDIEKRKKKIQSTSTSANSENQRELLIHQLQRNQYECMVCFESIRDHVATWHCDSCYHIFHLYCIKQWSKSSTGDDQVANSWRCPACQKDHRAVNGFRYECFCGKAKDPQFNVHYTPHSCGEVCGKSRGKECPHACNILCHPGPCPPCEAMVTRECPCGRTSQSLRCSRGSKITCAALCERPLNCTLHQCTQTCHKGPCKPCAEIIEQKCYCNQTSRTVVCGTKESFESSFACAKVCDRMLQCEHHPCEAPCHPGLCDSCSRMPHVVTHCPCGKKTLDSLLPSARSSCMDPIPVCENVCNRVLPVCKHRCANVCHEGACPPCPLSTELACRCGASRKTKSCAEAAKILKGEGGFRCQRRCRKMKTCLLHRCTERCCVLKEHTCNQICGKQLSCGQHRCDEVCHPGKCPTCWNVGWSEVYCECGASSSHPPISCGAPPPLCDRVCSREHPCTHQVHHKCHSDRQCPPCTELVTKICPGGHKELTNVPCFQPVVTCGLPCNKPLPNCPHSCTKLCHSGPCSTGPCILPCCKPRESCGHPCAARCHGDTGCPSVHRRPCRETVQLVCPCGRRRETVPCHSLDGPASFDMISANLTVSVGGAVNMSILDPKEKVKQLPCDSVCNQVQRNQRMAEALEIEDPVVEPTLPTPMYTKFVKDFALTNFNFLLSTEKAFEDLIKTANKSKYKSRCHNFQPMNRDKRRFVHELSDFYTLETQSYDQEPKRSVTATAYKEKGNLPSMKLSVVLIREYPQLSKGQKIVLGKPTLLDTCTTAWGSTSNMQVLGRVASAQSGSLRGPLASQTSSGSSGGTPEEERDGHFDYFDMKPVSETS